MGEDCPAVFAGARRGVLSPRARRAAMFRIGVSSTFPRAGVLAFAFERAGDGDPAMKSGLREGVVAVASCISSSARSESGNSIGGEEGGGEDMIAVDSGV